MLFTKLDRTATECLFIGQVSQSTASVLANASPASGQQPTGARQRAEASSGKSAAPSIRTLMEFVAWVVHADDLATAKALPGGGGMHETKTNLGYLRQEVAPVEEAARRIKASLLQS